MRDALIQPASLAQIRAFAQRKGVPEEKAREILEKLREQQIKARKADMFSYGYEPPIWLVAKAMFRGDVGSASEKKFVLKRYGMEWPMLTAKIRSRLGVKTPTGEVIVMGANRAGKTDFCAKFVMQECAKGKVDINIGFQSLPTGKQVQMPRVWEYMRTDWKARNIAGKKSGDVNEHISYTKQNGFSNSKITIGNGSSVRFVSYASDPATTMEGSALDDCWLDEEYPKAFLEAARFRLASKRGRLLGSFTPVSGYTPVIADMLSDLQVLRWHTAWMLPIDGGEPMPWMELGLDEDEYQRLVAWRNEGSEGDPGVPESRPEEIVERILDEGSRVDIDEIPVGRAFARTPRIGICRGGETAVVWFYGRDNPYGMPGEVIAKAMKNKNAVKEINCRVYGIAEQIEGRMFPEFSIEKVVVPANTVLENVIRIMVVDPAPERNWVFSWYAYEPSTDILYKYREWPSGYDIPGVGVPGAWAIASDRKMGLNDGDRGDAQTPFGFGYLAYKFEWARMEGWVDYEEWAANNKGKCEDWELLEDWSEARGAREKMEFRVIDARAGSQSKISMTGNELLFDEVSKLAEGFEPASGQKIEVGVNALRDRISTGRYKIFETCVNTIFAYRTYCGADGQKGACKDFIDMDRYAVLSGVCDRVGTVDRIGRRPISEMSMKSVLKTEQVRKSRRIWW